MKKNILNIVPFIGTLLCIIGYNIIGAEVLENGTLSEPFYLILIGWVFFFIGIIGLLTRLVLFSIKKIKK